MGKRKTHHQKTKKGEGKNEEEREKTSISKIKRIKTWIIASKGLKSTWGHESEKKKVRLCWKNERRFSSRYWSPILRPNDLKIAKQPFKTTKSLPFLQSKQLKMLQLHLNISKQ